MSGSRAQPISPSKPTSSTLDYTMAFYTPPTASGNLANDTHVPQTQNTKDITSLPRVELQFQKIQQINEDGMNDGDTYNDDYDPDDRIRRRDSSSIRDPVGQHTPMLLACPYFKVSPSEYLQIPACSRSGYSTIQLLREHLYQQHKQPLYCPRCFISFASKELLFDHMRSKIACSLREKIDLQGFTEDQERQLLVLEGTELNSSSKENWQRIFRILFPTTNDSMIPSPYHAEIPPAHMDILTGYNDFLQHEFPPSIREHLSIRLDGLVESIREPLTRETKEDIRKRILKNLPDISVQLFQTYQHQSLLPQAIAESLVGHSEPPHPQARSIFPGRQVQDPRKSQEFCRRLEARMYEEILSRFHEFKETLEQHLRQIIHNVTEEILVHTFGDEHSDQIRRIPFQAESHSSESHFYQFRGLDNALSLFERNTHQTTGTRKLDNSDKSSVPPAHMPTSHLDQTSCDLDSTHSHSPADDNSRRIIGDHHQDLTLAFGPSTMNQAAALKSSQVTIPAGSNNVNSAPGLEPSAVAEPWRSPSPSQVSSPRSLSGRKRLQSPQRLKAQTETINRSSGPSSKEILRHHSCSHCDKAFLYPKDLRRHLTTHSRGRPYKCQLCPKDFTRKDNLNRHMASDHGLPPPSNSST